jgi:hypothetical protein
MAQQLSQALNRPISFLDVSEKAFRDTLRDFRMPDWQAEGLIEDYAHYRRGEAAGISPAVKEVTGEEPRSFKQFARDHQAAFLQTEERESQKMAAPR